MPIITIFSGGFCQEEPIVREVISRTGYRQIADDEIVAEASRDQDELLVADLDLDQIREVREIWQFYRDRRPESYRGICEH